MLALLRVHHEAVQTHLFVWLVSESWCARLLRQRVEVRRDWTDALTLDTYQKTDWLCSAQLAARSSSLRVSETNTSSASAASPSLPFTRTVAAATQGRLGAAHCDQHKSPSLSFPLSLSPPGSVSLLKSGYRQPWLGR